MKIEPKLCEGLASDALNGVADTDPLQGAGSEPLDAVDRIVVFIDTGQIGQQEALNQMLDGVCSMPILREAPARLRSEIREALGMLLYCEPQLRSLIAIISSRP